MNKQLTERFEFKRDPVNGALIGIDGAHYDTAAEAFYYGELDFCGCGGPDQVYNFVIDCISSIRDNRDAHRQIEILIKQQSTTAAEMILHFLDSKGITEHTGAVYCSQLTPKGHQIIECGRMSE